MKVHLIKKQTLEDFARRHPRSKSPLEDCTEKLRFADWEQPNDIKHTHNTADILGKNSNRVIFDIGGNNANMFSVQNKLICLYAGWEHMPSTIKFVIKVTSTLLIFIEKWNQQH
jgi:mRNA-degrading endonuclease HigB of HigAB toxin-antitoxin module